MSFICAITGKPSQPREKPIRIIVKKRPREYFEDRLNEDTDQYEQTLVGRGWEIEKELLATEEGYLLWQKTQAALGVDPDLITTTATKK